MQLHDAFPASHASINYPANSKSELIRDLGVRLCRVAGVDPKECVQALLDREALGSTGMGDGTAIPHARLAALREPIGFVVRLRKAIDFEAIDGRPVSLVCLLLLPAGNATLASETLAKASRRFRDPVALKGLQNAVSNAAFHQAFVTR
ncbi:PTS sugar transporter subunit IIA [Methylopila turkensis]|uniref:PTS IIA-like nitrogen-regulatory protein PtsN n=1 Tax=Methylopila turkensis TaxID=1437816 RepID=A0A9W6N718_9HYPH|nr:PTS sugar transporter subunit IIA [Methylopila turkensis]GLK80083.1 PTS IIA-like nitrogen-regulatory protein PtsN [Methylopila turkensis]